MARSTIEGTVTTVSSKDWWDARKGRNITLYSFQVDSDRRWFRTGTDNPDLAEGEYIKFVADEKNGVSPNFIERAPKPSAPAASPAGPNRGATSTRQASSSGGGAANRDAYWAAKEARDLEKDERYQTVDVPRMSFSASQERAVAFVTAALAADAVTLPTKKGDKLGALLDVVDEVTKRFFVQAMEASAILEAAKAEETEASKAVEVGVPEDAYDE